MREIKFRGKDLKDQSWHIGDLEYNPAAKVARIHSYDEYGFYSGNSRVDPDTVGQFTGLYDAKGREIYEGDIFRVGDHTIRVVYELDRENGFALRIWKSPTLNSNSWLLPLEKSFVTDYEIAGNIYDEQEQINAN